MTEFQGKIRGEGKRFAIVVSRFNEFLTRSLVEGGVTCLKEAGVAEEGIDVYWVPGAFELPLVCRRAAQSGKYDAVIALGCLIRGGTPHFHYVSLQAAMGVGEASQETGVPVLFGVVTAENLEQATERCSVRAGNRGGEVARAALEMADLMKQLPKP